VPLPNILNRLPPMSGFRTVRQLRKLRPVLRAARPTVGAARARGFAVSAPALKSDNKLASSSSGTSPPLLGRRIFPSEFAPAATTLLAQKLRAEISYEAEVQQDDVQVGAVPQDLVKFLQEGGWEVRCVLRPAHGLMGRQITDTPANDEVFLTRKFGHERYVVSSFHLSLLMTSTASASCSPSQTCSPSPMRTSLRARTTRGPRVGTSRRYACR
jgi:hypothetical protein